MTSAASKRSRDQRPSKEDRERALGDALNLSPSRPVVQEKPAPAPLTEAVRGPLVRRSRAKYAA